MPQVSFEDGDKVLDGVRFDVFRVGYPKRDGGVQQREVVVPPNAAVIVPVMDNGDVVLIRNERFSVGKTLLEVPAGTLEDGEDPLDAATRELPEETGYKAASIKPLCEFYPSPGFCTEYMHVYLAQGLTHVGQSLDETENIVVEVTPLGEAIKMIGDGRIIDGKTIAALLYYRTFTAKAGD